MKSDEKEELKLSMEYFDQLIKSVIENSDETVGLDLAKAVDAVNQLNKILETGISIFDVEKIVKYQDDFKLITLR